MRRTGGLRKRKDACPGLHAGDRRRDVSLLYEGAIEQQHSVAARFRHVVTGGRHLSLVARWNEQVVPARTLIRAGQSHVGHPAKIGVIDGPEYTWRHPHHHRSITHVDTQYNIHGGGIGSQEQRAGIHEFLGDADALIELDARLFKPLTERVD